MFEKVLLAVDGSDHALHAARVAADLARTMKSKEFRIVVVYDSIPPYLGEPNMQYAIDARMKEAQSSSGGSQSSRQSACRNLYRIDRRFIRRCDHQRGGYARERRDRNGFARAGYTGGPPAGKHHSKSGKPCSVPCAYCPLVNFDKLNFL
jgi:hypothetical protein